MSSIWGAIYQATFGAYQEWRDGRRRKAEAQRTDAVLDRVLSNREAAPEGKEASQPDEASKPPGS